VGNLIKAFDGTVVFDPIPETAKSYTGKSILICP